MMIGGGRTGENGPFSICKGKDNKQNSKALFLKHPHIRPELGISKRAKLSRLSLLACNF